MLVQKENENNLIMKRQKRLNIFSILEGEGIWTFTMFFKKLIKKLKDIGFYQSNADPCLIIWKSDLGIVFVAIYVALSEAAKEIKYVHQILIFWRQREALSPYLPQ